MRAVADLLRQSSNVLAFGHTKTGCKLAESIVKLPSLTMAKRLVQFLSILVDLSSVWDACVVSTLKVRPICIHLNEHFKDEIDFAKLSKRCDMDQASLCRFFRRATGRTMTAYLNELRDGAAAQLLIDTEARALEIAFQVGFGNYSNFNRQFKRIKGIAPMALRRQFPPEQSVGKRRTG